MQSYEHFRHVGEILGNNVRGQRKNTENPSENTEFFLFTQSRRGLCFYAKVPKGQPTTGRGVNPCSWDKSKRSPEGATDIPVVLSITPSGFLTININSRGSVNFTPACGRSPLRSPFITRGNYSECFRALPFISVVKSLSQSADKPSAVRWRAVHSLCRSRPQRASHCTADKIYDK